MDSSLLQDSTLDSGKAVAPVIDRPNVTPVGGTEPGLRMPDNPVSEPFDGESEWPTDPNEDWFEDPDADLERVGHDWPGEPDEAWVSDPDAYLEEVVDYMKRLHALCEGSDEFVAALKGLFPELEEKVAQDRALGAEDIGDDELDPDAAIAAGRSVFYSSGAEMLAADMATISDPVVRD